MEELELELEKRKEELGLGESVSMRPENQVTVGSAAQRRARMLIWGHLLRFEFDEKDLKDGKQPSNTLSSMYPGYRSSYKQNNDKSS